MSSIQVKAIFVGLTVLLLLASGWGYFEPFADIPGIPMLWLNPVYWFTYGLSALFFSRAEGAEA
ncbi:MAG: hypothetical protein MO852_06960 [Candidatus Devosia euplotis]|nr:hypothetical protein [Candidatus Devosia euplotis]